MGRRVILFMTSFCIGFSSLFAEAKAPLCENVFTPSMGQVLRNLDLESNGALLAGKSLKEWSESLSWNRRRQLRKFTQTLALEEVPSRQALERKAMMLGEILFGKNNIADRFILQSPTDRFYESTGLITKKDLLREGLLKTWMDVYDVRNISLISTSLDRVIRFTTNPLVQTLYFPFFIPTLKDRRLPPELLRQVLRDGFEAHEEQVRAALRFQTSIETYNTFRRLYSPIFFGTMIIVAFHMAEEEKRATIAAQVAEVVEQLREQRVQAKEGILRTKAEILEEAYQNAKADFIAKWGESPTPEEESLIREEIRMNVFKKPQE